ncbi:MAG: trypsin-like serine protease [Myxococcales bacterium]|nr:trypsin-like serine protease [Myxococcales bacterium]
MRAALFLAPLLALAGCQDARLRSSGPSGLVVPTDAGVPPENKPAVGDPRDVDAGPRPLPPRPDAAVSPPPPEPDAAAAPPPPPDFPDGQDACGDIRVAEKVYHGTREPSALPLTPGQILAVGSFNGCSGTLIAERFVLSATHCGHRRGAEFCMGPDPDRPNACLRAVAVHENPRADQTILEMDRDASSVLPGVQPIPILTEVMDNGWIGRTAEAAGYGQTEYGGFNTRWFTAEPIVRLSSDTVTIDGQGRRGVCFGDSGGPVMVQASDGSVRVAGDLSNGDGSCVGRDNYTRTDVFVDWIEGFTGPTVVDGAPCGPVTAEGRCLDGVAQWCEGDELQTDRCAVRCGFDARADGYRCLQGADPCGGYDAAGACDGQTARWCEAGAPRARDCGACGESCAVVAGVGAACTADPCAGLDYQGRCTGDTAEWCDDGELHTEDCGQRGQRCGWVNQEIGYFCN